MDKDLATHKMSELVALVDKTAVPISPEEAALLENLEPYVVWAGRYPFPKKQEDLFVKLDSSQEHSLMESFWCRLREYMKRVGWVTKMSGHQLPTA